jgi:hypothetical protein
MFSALPKTYAALALRPFVETRPPQITLEKHLFIDKTQTIMILFKLCGSHHQKSALVSAVVPFSRRLRLFLQKQRETANNSEPFRCYSARRNARGPGFPPRTESHPLLFRG